MKKLIIVFALLALTATASFAQDDGQGGQQKVVSTDTTIVDLPQMLACFAVKIDDVEIDEWIKKNIVYPASCKKKDKKGFADIRFVVETDGSIGNFEVINSSNKDVSAEAIRLMQSMPKWSPGELNDTIVRSYVRFSLQIDLSGSYSSFKDWEEANFVFMVTEKSVRLEIPEIMAQFPGGDTALYEWLGKNFKLPKEIEAKELPSRINLQLRIEKDGTAVIDKITNIDDQEVFDAIEKIIKKMPKWKPARQAGRIVRSYLSLPITYRKP